MMQNQEHRLQVFINSQEPLGEDPGDSMVCKTRTGNLYRVYAVAYHKGMKMPPGFDTVVWVKRKVVRNRLVADLKSPGGQKLELEDKIWYN